MSLCLQHSCNNNKWFIWSVDATLDYSSNPRLPLLIFSSILLFIGIVYTLLVFSSQWLQRYSYICCRKASRDPVFRLKPLIDAYCGPYKDSCRFWTGLLLIVRLVLTGLFSYTSSMNYQVNNIIILGIVLLLTSLAWIVEGMYKTRELNTIEFLSYLNIGFVALSSIMTNGQYSQVIISEHIYWCSFICSYSTNTKSTVKSSYIEKKECISLSVKCHSLIMMLHHLLNAVILAQQQLL